MAWISAHSTLCLFMVHQNFHKYEPMLNILDDSDIINNEQVLFTVFQLQHQNCEHATQHNNNDDDCWYLYDTELATDPTTWHNS